MVRCRRIAEIISAMYIKERIECIIADFVVMIFSVRHLIREAVMSIPVEVIAARSARMRRRDSGMR